MDKEKIIDLVNDIVVEAVSHGGDAGGSYGSNEEDLVSIMNDLITYLDVNDVYEVRGDNPQIVRKVSYFDEITKVLGAIHKKAPQVRFNQLISNLHSNFVKQNPLSVKTMYIDTHLSTESMKSEKVRVTVPELFYVSDERFLDFLKQELASMGEVRPKGIVEGLIDKSTEEIDQLNKETIAEQIKKPLRYL